MKTCEEYEALISAFLDGELSGEEREYEQMELIRKVLDCFENI